VGKSTLISRISSARPKIGDYPFTTLEPNLGVVAVGEYRSFVVADIPGLIEGAHLGHGLGIQFLRHVERTKVLLHLIDLSEMHEGNPKDDFETVNRELEEFNPAILLKPTLLVGAKVDAMNNPSRLKKLLKLAKGKGLECVAISSATGLGIPELKFKVAQMLDQAAAVSALQSAEVPRQVNIT
jgi:GTP-binding protein